MGKPLELMADVKHFQVDTLPVSPEANAYYNLRLSDERYVQYITDGSGVYHAHLNEGGVSKKSSDYELENGDGLKHIVNSSSGDVTITIPTGLDANMIVTLERAGTGRLIVAAASSVFLMGDEEGYVEENAFELNEVPSAAYLRHDGSDNWIIIGNLI